MENKNIFPYRIKQARVSRNMSILELAEKLNVSKQVISQYELGKTEPSKSTLNSMSTILKYPVAFFYKPVCPDRSADSAVFFRSGKTASVKNYNAAKMKIEIFGEINDYFEEYVNFPATNFPKVEYPEFEDMITHEKMEQFALAIRDHWGLGLGPVNNLIGTIEKNGIIVSRINLGLSKIDGFSLWHNNTPIIFIGSDKNSAVRVRFSVAHEIAHLFLHADFFTDDELKDKTLYNRLESEANYFAGAFLLPSETFSKDIYSTSLDHFIQLKSKWKTAISTMIYRCDALGLLSQNQFKYLKDQMTVRGYWRKEPLDDALTIEKPVMLKQAIDLLLENKVVSAYDLLEGNGVFLDELEEYCFLDKGRLTSEDKSNVVSLRLIK